MMIQPPREEVANQAIPRLISQGMFTWMIPFERLSIMYERRLSLQKLYSIFRSWPSPAKTFGV